MERSRQGQYSREEGAAAFSYCHLPARQHGHGRVLLKFKTAGVPECVSAGHAYSERRDHDGGVV